MESLCLTAEQSTEVRRPIWHEFLLAECGEMLAVQCGMCAERAPAPRRRGFGAAWNPVL